MLGLHHYIILLCILKMYILRDCVRDFNLLDVSIRSSKDYHIVVSVDELSFLFFLSSFLSVFDFLGYVSHNKSFLWFLCQEPSMIRERDSLFPHRAQHNLFGTCVLVSATTTAVVPQ